MAKFRVRVSVEMEEESNNWGSVLYSEEPFQVELLDPPPESVQVNLSDNLSLGDKIS